MSELRRYLKNTKANNRKRKGISPVIATVILVAVAVVIAAALAGFSGSLFGTYQNTAQIQVKEAHVHLDGTGSVTILNKGSSQDTVVSVTGAAADNTMANTALPANQQTNVPLLDVKGVGTTFNIGQQITLKITLGSGQEILQSVSVEA